MSETTSEIYGPLLIAALEHERSCYTTLLQVGTEQARNADARLAAEYEDRMSEARTRWMAATRFVGRLQQRLGLESETERPEG